MTTYRATTTALDTAAGAADRARQLLTEDDDRRASLQPAIAAGTSAEARARMRLRTRMADALSSDAPPPGWFVIALGFRPARGTAASAWMDLATDVLAYRLTYSITSHTDALGPDPTSHPDQDPDRVRYNQQIRRRLTP